MREQIVERVVQQVRQNFAIHEAQQRLDNVIQVRLQQQIWARLWDQIYEKVQEKLQEKTDEELNRLYERHFSAQVYGSHDAHWLGLFDVFSDFGLDLDFVQPLIRLAQHCGWWAPYKNLCILQHRHSVCKLEDGQLHCEDGPAIRYRDGFEVWAINGVRVDEQIVMRPETQTIEQIHNEQNVEVRRLRIERYGWIKYLQAVQAEEVDCRRNDVEGTDEVLYKTENGYCVLVCACPSTERIYALEVPPETETCKDAQRWLSSGLSDRIISAS